jgi:3-hydroxybutyryl-CoA dehydrogenase
MATIGVVGAGIMGRQISALLASHGYSVKLVTHRPSQIIEDKLKPILRQFSRKLNISKEASESVHQRIQIVDNLESIKDSFLVIETIIEDLKSKQELFKKLDSICPSPTLLASNTSSLDIGEIYALAAHPSRIIGLHFFNPIIEIDFVEFITTSLTSSEVKIQADSFIKSLNMVMVSVPLSCVNRILIPMINEASHVLSEGIASADDIDKSIKLSAKHPLGPLSLADLIGVDIVIAILESFRKKYGDKYTPAPILYTLLKEGRLGRKTGHGFFSYGKKRERTS